MAERVTLREQRPDELDSVQVTFTAQHAYSDLHPRAPRVSEARFLAVGRVEALRPFIDAHEFRLAAIWAKGFDALPPRYDGDCRVEEISIKLDTGQIEGSVSNLVLARPAEGAA